MAEYRKAIVGALLAGLAALGAALADGAVTSLEVVTIVTAIVVAGAAVWRVPNEPPAGQ